MEQKIEMSNEEKWDEDYNELRSGKNFRENLDVLTECLYEYHGKLEVTEYNHGDITTIFNITSDCLAYLDVNSLINREDEKEIIPTEKGKYFLKKHIQEKNNIS